VSDNSTYLQAVTEVARVAGDIADQHYRKRVSVETKIDGTPVTIADRSAEETARKWIEQGFPEDGILGEEFPTVRGGARRSWIIDPIDGTKTFIRDVPLWGSLVAVIEDKRVIAGAAYFPAVSEVISAAVGCGCWWNDSRAQVSSIDDLAKATVLTSASPFSHDDSITERWRELEAATLVSRTWGDCFGYLMVATGRAEVMADPVLSLWDIAAFLPIISEAGGVLTDFTGAETAFGGNAIATNRALSESARKILIPGTYQENR
jgi:histidinol phosphatase-like enzyme (inositol monophosphatase family)